MTRSVQDVGLWVKRLQMQHQHALNAALAPLGVSLVQWDALRHLAQHPGASLHDLAQLTFQTDQSFGGLAGRLVERGLIERVTGPGRAVRPRLTERGADLQQAGCRIVDRVLAESFAPLGAVDLAAFDAFLTRLVDAPVDAPVDAAVDAAGPEGPPGAAPSPGAADGVVGSVG